MKKAIIIVILVAAGFGGDVLWMKHREAPALPAGEHAADAKAPADKQAAAAQLARDTNGNAVITMNEKIWKNLGLQIKSPERFQMNPELKGYGRVLDPAPLAALVTELATAQAAYTGSSNELVRLKALEGQGNASARLLQAAEAAAGRDQVALQSVRGRLLLQWGKAVAEQKDLPAFARSLAALEAALVRIDLPAGETLNEPPAGARIATLSGSSSEGDFLGLAPNVDPQFQGHGFLFLLKSNPLGLAAGQSVVGYLRVSGAPVAGVIVPRDAVVRTEGAGWVYVLNAAGTAFTRVQVALDRPTEGGWFVAAGVSAGDRIVVSAAQQLLSFELKGAGAEE